jgi:hypothetical protein
VYRDRYEITFYSHRSAMRFTPDCRVAPMLPPVQDAQYRASKEDIMTKLITSLAALSLLVAVTGSTYAITLQTADGPAEFGAAPQTAAPTTAVAPKVRAAARGAFAMQPGADTSREALDRDDFGSNRSKIMNVIDSHGLAGC